MNLRKRGFVGQTVFKDWLGSGSVNISTCHLKLHRQTLKPRTKPNPNAFMNNRRIGNR